MHAYVLTNHTAAYTTAISMLSRNEFSEKILLYFNLIFFLVFIYLCFIFVLLSVILFFFVLRKKKNI